MLSSLTVWLPIAVAVGASLMLLTVSWKLLSTVALLLSVAITLMSRFPTSLLVGVPVNIPVVLLNVNQLGNVVPSAKVAWEHR
ncbi:hypothetical protein L2E71_00180 [Planktothrix agardhii 1032]|nr:hypothetical protein [Planktothrix agardhii]MCF3596511.1 hypothetical protein [Planktothrix agardhii 1032]